MSQRAYHWLIVGGTGGGKTFTMTQLCRAYMRKARYVVLVNSSEELSEFARHHVVIDDAALERDHDPRQLARLIHRYGAVHFEVTPGDPKRVAAFMDALGTAVMSLGLIKTPHCRVFMVMDECQNWISGKVWSKGMRRVFTEGRKYGIHTMSGTLQFSGQGNEIISMTAKKMMTVLVICPMDEENEREKLMRTYPDLPNPEGLTFPDPKTGRPGGRLVRDRITRRAVMVKVSPEGKAYAVAVVGDLPKRRAA